jgi:hypothetical protein
MGHVRQKFRFEPRGFQRRVTGFRQLMVGSLQLRPSLVREFHGFNQHENFGNLERKHDGGRHRS